MLSVQYKLLYLLIPILWRDGRVDECDGLENRYTGNGIVGSNPTPSVAYNACLDLVAETVFRGVVN